MDPKNNMGEHGDVDGVLAAFDQLAPRLVFKVDETKGTPAVDYYTPEDDDGTGEPGTVEGTLKAFEALLPGLRFTNDGSIAGYIPEPQV